MVNSYEQLKSVAGCPPILLMNEWSQTSDNSWERMSPQFSYSYTYHNQKEKPSFTPIHKTIQIFLEDKTVTWRFWAYYIAIAIREL